MALYWGPEHIFIYNDAFLRSLGDREPWLMARPAAEALPEVWSVMGPRIEHVMRTAESVWDEDCRFAITHRGRAEESYWTYSLTPVFEEDGTVGGVVSAGMETTSRVQAERRIRTMRSFFDRSLKATSASEVSVLAVEALQEERWEFAFATVYELDARRIPRVRYTTLALGDSIDELDEHVRRAAEAHPMPKSSVVRLSPVHVSTSPVPEPVTEALVVPIPTTGEHVDEIIAYGLNPRLRFRRDQRTYLEVLAEKIAVVRDRLAAFEAQAKAERQRRDLLVQSPLPMVLMIGPELVIEMANPAFLELVGRDVVGKRVVDAFPEAIGTEAVRILQRAYATGEPFRSGEQRIPLRRGGANGTGALEDHWFTFNVQPMREPTGKVYGMLTVAMDITETVVARRTLEKLHDEREKLLTALERASRTKDEFLAMLGHELRNPLAPIKTALHVMKLKQPNAHRREREIIERQVSHLARLVDDLLDVARIAQGKVELHPCRVSLASVIAHAIEMSSPLFERKGHVLTIDASPTDLDVHGDPMRLEQVFTNLLTNAAKYTEPGGHIDVRAFREGEQCVVRVSDDGTGIAPDQLPYVFDAFFQGTRARNHASGGLGLGLALVKSLVSLHGGVVTAHSPGVGRGSVFEVRLPALPAVEAVAEPQVVPERRTVAPPADRRRVLLVDDSEDILEIVSSLLTFEGYEVRAAHDARSALQAAMTFHPDVAVLDIGLPEMDGYELAQHLREELGDRTPKLVAMTGYGQSEDSARARAAGFEAHLVKPVDPEALLESIRR